jgi:CDGSH-type Zn-finger protein
LKANSQGTVKPVPAKEAVVITPYRDGPLLVRGNFHLLDQAGNLIECRRQTVALCRCGRSRNKPFCDGTHKLIGFRADAPAEREPRPDAPAKTVSSALE